MAPFSLRTILVRRGLAWALLLGVSATAKAQAPSSAISVSLATGLVLDSCSGCHDAETGPAFLGQVTATTRVSRVFQLGIRGHFMRQPLEGERSRKVLGVYPVAVLSPGGRWMVTSGVGYSGYRVDSPVSRLRSSGFGLLLAVGKPVYDKSGVTVSVSIETSWTRLHAMDYRLTGLIIEPDPMAFEERDPRNAVSLGAGVHIAFSL